MSDLPILSSLEKKIILVLGEGYEDFKEVSRFKGQDIKYNLNRLNEKYNKPYRSHVPYSTLKQLVRKELVDTVIDTLEGREITYYLLNEKGIVWYGKAREIIDHIYKGV
jgi:DNA-binding PadR family transcriptional regulator